jgi:hypothetical protein
VFGEVYNLFDNANARGMWTQLQVARARVLVVTRGAHAVGKAATAGLSWEF